jgi:transcriptional regulator with XRE-family HTH domain
MKLNDYLKYERKKQKLTLIQLASKAKITYGMLYRLEEGSIKRPKPELLKKVGTALSLNYEQLLMDYGYLILPESSSVAVELMTKDVILLSDFEKSKSTVIGAISDCFIESVEFVVQCDSEYFMPFASYGDFLGVSIAQDIQENALYMVRQKGRVRFCYVKKRGENIFLVDYQQPYSDLEYSKSDIYKIIYRSSDQRVFSKK